jgi:hypothetical protein
MKNKYLDLLERTAWTAVQAFLGVMIALDITGTIVWKDVLYSAGIAALIAAAKCILAFQVGDPNSAALLPEKK